MVRLNRRHVIQAAVFSVILIIMFAVQDIVSGKFDLRNFLVLVGLGLLLLAFMAWDNWRQDNAIERDLRAERRRARGHARLPKTR